MNDCASFTPVLISAGEVQTVAQGRREVQIVVSLPKELSCFVGHFPGFPLVPGFVQLEWVRLFAVSNFQIEGRLKAVGHTKFLSPLVPNRCFQFTLEENLAEDVKIDFAIAEQLVTNKQRICTKGSFNFERFT